MFARPIPKLCKCTCVAYGARSLTETGLRWSIKPHKTTQRLQIPACQSKIRFFKCIFSQDCTPTSIIFKTSSFWCITCCPVSRPFDFTAPIGPIPTLRFSIQFLIFLAIFFIQFFTGSVSFFVKGASNSFSFDPSTGWIVRLPFDLEKTREIWKQYKTMIYILFLGDLAEKLTYSQHSTHRYFFWGFVRFPH